MGNYERTRRFQQRMKQYALDVIGVYRKIPKQGEGRVVGKQFLRSGTSVAANYRSACRGRSAKEFIAKLGIVIEETDETIFWLGILRDSNIYKGNEINRGVWVLKLSITNVIRSAFGHRFEMCLRKCVHCTLVRIGKTLTIRSPPEVL